MTKKNFLKMMVIFGIGILTSFSAMAADPVRIAVLTDLSGPYSSISGNDVESARMAIKDFGGSLFGMEIELLYRDNQSKADVGNQKAIELYQKENVDAIFDCPNSAAALAVSNQAQIYKKLFFSVTSGTTRITGPDCNRYTFHWAWNDYMLVTSVGLWAADNLGKKWYTITADYAWGHDLFGHLTNALKKKEATLLGNDMVALGTGDFSAYIINAAKMNPEVLALLNAGRDAVNSTKQAVEFGLKKKVKIIHGFLIIDDINAAGPEVFAGDYTASSWYWKSNNPGAKEFVEKWRKRFNRPPNWINAATYSCVTQYLEAVKRAGTKDSKAVIKALEGHTFRDFFANPGHIQPEDHMQVGTAYIVKAKDPNDIKEPWDFFEVVGSVPPELAYMDPTKTGCKMGDF